MSSWESVGLYDPGILTEHGIKDLEIGVDGADIKVSAMVDGKACEVRVGAASGFGVLDPMARSIVTNSLLGALMRAADDPPAQQEA